MTEALENKLREIEESKDHHLSLCETMLRAGDSKLFSMDIMVAAAIKRSLALSDAFASLVRSQNYSIAASLCRLQLDSCLRLSAAYRVQDPHQLASDVLAGKPIRKMKDRDGQKMTDRYLSETLGLELDWVPRVYNSTSGFIHLSEKHLVSIFGEMDSDTGRTSIEIGPGDQNIPNQYWLEMASGFLATTDLLIQYVEGWISAKNRNSGSQK